MSETAPVVASPVAEKPVSPPKKAVKSIAAAKPKAANAHPPVSDMVVNAVKTLKERGGSSLQAIKKFLAAQYKVDVEKLAPFIKKYLKTAVAKGQLLQTKGKGASGSFKLPAASKKQAAPKAKAVKTKSAQPKKAVGEKKKSVAKKPKAAGSPTKIKKPVVKTAKKPVAAKPAKKAAPSNPKVSAKPKAAPKPKKAAAPKKSAPVKKAAAAKKPAAVKKVK